MKFAVASATLLFSCALCAATPIDGWYSSAFGGYAYLPNNLNKTTLNFNRTHASYQSGFDAGGNFGFKSNPMRYEGEVTFLKATLSGFDVNRVRQTQVSGFNDALLGMANVYYDFPGCSTLLQPFLGAGIGYAWIKTNMKSAGPLIPTTFDTSNSAFAYQATGGLTYNFSENYALNLGYRYVATTHISDLGQIVQAHLANVGATYRFDGNNYK